MSGIGGQANNMDSISRPTSRVLRAPGGGSSNIFGAEPEPAKEFNKNDPRHKTNNIFGAPEAVQNPAQPVATSMEPQCTKNVSEPPAPVPTSPCTNSAKENHPVGVSYFCLSHITYYLTLSKSLFRLLD